MLNQQVGLIASGLKIHLVEKAPDFPCFMRGRETGVIYLMTSSSVGVVMHDPRDDHTKVTIGTCVTKLNPNNLDLWRGNITFEQV